MHIFSKIIIILFITFMISPNVLAKTNEQKEAEIYYKKGISISKEIIRNRNYDENIDCSFLEKQALENYTKAIELYPNYSKAYYKRAELTFYDIKKYIEKESLLYPMHIIGEHIENLINDYSKVISLESNNIDARCKKVFLELFYDKAGTIDPKSTEKQYIEAQEKHLTNINNEINEILKLSPLCAEAYMYQGILYGFYYNGYNSEKQTNLFKEHDSIELKTRHTPEVNMEKENLEEGMKLANKMFSTSISLKPNNSIAFFYRAHFRHQLGDLQGSIDDITRAIEIEPNNANYYSFRADLRFYDAEDYRHAYEDYKTAKDLSINNNTEIYSNSIDKIKLLEEYYSDAIIK